MLRAAVRTLVVGITFVPGVLGLAGAPALAGQRPAATPPRAAPPAQAPYFPARLDWQHKNPRDVGIDTAALDDAVKFAVASEATSTKDLADNLAAVLNSFGDQILPADSR